VWRKMHGPECIVVFVAVEELRNQGASTERGGHGLKLLELVEKALGGGGRLWRGGRAGDARHRKILWEGRKKTRRARDGRFDKGGERAVRERLRYDHQKLCGSVGKKGGLSRRRMEVIKGPTSECRVREDFCGRKGGVLV